MNAYQYGFEALKIHAWTPRDYPIWKSSGFKSHLGNNAELIRTEQMQTIPNNKFFRCKIIIAGIQAFYFSDKHSWYPWN